MLKRILLLWLWPISASLVLYLAFAVSHDYFMFTSPEQVSVPDQTLLYAAIPATVSEIKTSVRSLDARPEIARQYLKKYNSPLYPYAELIVKTSDENGIDFRWLIAIAQQESNLCKRIPENSYNCWGWGIYGDKVTRFNSYEHAITAIAPQFKQKFLTDGHRTEADDIMKTYTPPSDGSWSFGVNQFMSEME
ncbi:hypothetical protein A2368_03985 [Candidatus Collierbacteria bacterium RIFOXYB1_FULL_49_13]|uniref:Mannosyl-glycoprotein endo-beta-N-acetylglucosamidase-like domain-containing protein n=1 Tax=Candidatus Collierbacteria bacterium RIFOXYB1_FULL_49_13 TaxID=1817728 RepID=A0A1F5FJH5_9BACT|nr:MAG: hypothetical protein A2368_03985 [Candidatus Collierbacteria bacterium RIFOXYB1_FULL_49_13]